MRQNFNPMTKINNELSGHIKVLYEAGIEPKAISKQLLVNYNTLKSHLRKMKLMATLPPKVLIKQNYFTGRIPGIIRRYLEEYPTANDSEVVAACELTCSRQYLNKYLNRNGLQRTKAKC